MYVYRVAYKNQLGSIFSNGYSRQFLGSNEGTLYGDGIYCTALLKQSVYNQQHHQYGNCIVRMILRNGLDRFLIFNEEFASSVYGANHSIKDQVYYLFPKEVADKVWEHMVYIMKCDTSARNHMHGRTCELLQQMLGRSRSLNKRTWYEELFNKYNIRGVVYFGNKDGLCVVPYVFNDIIPDAYSVDLGKTFIKKEFTNDIVDVTHAFGGLYKKIDEPVKAHNEEGNETWYSRVKKDNGKWNYLNAKTGKEISTVDFDSVTEIDPNTEEFTIEYKGRFFTACIQGYYPDEESYNNGDGLTFDELLNMDENLTTLEEAKYEKYLNEAINRALRLFENGTSLQTESICDETKHWIYDVPEDDELESDNVVNLYHRTSSMNAVEGLFKNGVDQEFGKVMVYGRGFYTCPTVEDSRKVNYGPYMVQLKLIGGFDRFLSWIPEYTQKIYGNSRMTILDQLRSFLPQKSAEEAYRVGGNTANDRYAKISSRYKIRGMIYQYGNAIAVLPFDFTSVIPYAYSTDLGKTFIKKYNDDTRRRARTSFDVVWLYGDKYEIVDKAIAGHNENGEETGYSRVKKHTGKYNMIDIQTGEEISPIDFDSITEMNPDTEEFTIEYKGRFFIACPQGYFPNEESYNSGDGLTFDELLNEKSITHD